MIVSRAALLRLLPLSVTIAVLVWLLLHSGSEDEPPSLSDTIPVPQQVVAQKPYQQVEGDSTADTIRTLVAQLDGLSSRMEQFNAEHLQRYQAMEKHYATLEQRLGEFADRVGKLEIQQTAAAARQTDSEWELPVANAEKRDERIFTNLSAAPQQSVVAPDSAQREQPALTVPANTIFFDSVALTAMIGRIPVDGTVHAPFPVKIVVGKDNVAAGGFTIPAVEGMLLSGQVVGDWVLKCVRVNLHSAAFIFSDGTIAQLQIAGEAGNGGDGRIGWLSDRYGVPCIPGRLVTTAGREALSRILLGAARGYAAGQQDGEVTRITSADGNILSSLSGDSADFRRGGALGSALAEWERFITERNSGKFDAVVIPAGVTVIAHITRQLIIDYPLQGRKLVYATGGRGGNAKLD